MINLGYRSVKNHARAFNDLASYNKYHEGEIYKMKTAKFPLTPALKLCHLISEKFLQSVKCSLLNVIPLPSAKCYLISEAV